ncbi:hypothetical protein BKA70DRAFT_1267969 [Coprinopsis sp. MPI-PUGE-AT-0042]|nr:hypothetical protein BKA70DRAFT_1267969 [Coprinopsis sp. MPI-PUGE-AT-0042]
MASTSLDMPSTSSAAPESAVPTIAIQLPSSRPPSYEGGQAGPLPSKRGELGFIEGVHGQANDQACNDTGAALPARHPADRDAPSADGDSTSTPPTASGDAAQSSAPSATTPTTATPPTNKPSSFKNKTFFGGIRIATFLIFLAQILFLGGFIGVWVITTQKVFKTTNGGNFPGGLPSTVFIHVVFVFVLIGQLVFLERRIYTIRAERYAYLHPGEMLPRYRNRTREGGDLNFAYAPWNRPPLPTYAAVLAQSGAGTGDVEDHVIAVAPPPAYGNTRGSRMLLQGFLTDELRAQRPTSAHSTIRPEVPNDDLDLERGEANGTERVERRRGEALAQLENGPRTGGNPVATISL